MTVGGRAVTLRLTWRRESRRARGARWGAFGLALLLIAGTRPVMAQSPADGRAGGNSALSLVELLRTVRERHPVVRQAELAWRAADAEVRVALGAWEPVLAATADHKTSKGKTYYDEQAFKLVLPTPSGVDVKLGFERAGGSNLNPESVVPARGLWSLGVSLPLGPRALLDERRTTIDLARAARDAAAGERTGTVAKLLLSATKDWSVWYEQEERATIARDGERLARERERLVRARVSGGDASPIDTVEASLEVDRRAIARSEAEAAATTARLAVSAHLWEVDGDPRDLVAGSRPTVAAGEERLPADSTLLAYAERAHPEVVKLSAKVRQGELQRRLALQGLWPSAGLEVAATGEGGVPNAWSRDDAKGGANLKLSPLLLKDRAKLASITAKWERDRAELARVRREVTLQVRDALNVLRALGDQEEGQARAVDRARVLRDGEQRRFEVGESSLLLVNLRERALLDERLKLAALSAKRIAARAQLALAVGDPRLLDERSVARDADAVR